MNARKASVYAVASHAVTSACRPRAARIVGKATPNIEPFVRCQKVSRGMSHQPTETESVSSIQTLGGRRAAGSRPDLDEVSESCFLLADNDTTLVDTGLYTQSVEIILKSWRPSSYWIIINAG